MEIVQKTDSMDFYKIDQEKQMNVLSLFDGISCGQLALQRAGVSYNNYYASEIDKHAIGVTQRNFPNTKQLGDVTRVASGGFPHIDLLIGGSPCQGFSFAGKQLNFDDPRSKLFFEYVRLLRELMPTYFLLENVCMKKEFESIITEALGVEPVCINSNVFSAQDRKRLYWTNIPIDTLPEVCSETLENILETSIGGKYLCGSEQVDAILASEVIRGKIDRTMVDYKPVYSIHNHTIDFRKSGDGVFFSSANEPCMPCLTPHRATKRQNGRRFKPPHSKFYTLTAQDVHGVLQNRWIRKLTPIEYERLQTVPDNYTSGCSDSQRYKMLGNGWTVDVIAHIFKSLKQGETNE